MAGLCGVNSEAFCGEDPKKHKNVMAELPAHASARRRALHAILRANRGVPLGWRWLSEILAERRSSAADTDLSEKMERPKSDDR